MKNNEVLVEGNSIKIKENNEIKDLGNQGSSSVYAPKYYKILDNSDIVKDTCGMAASVIKSYKEDMYYILNPNLIVQNKLVDNMLSFSYVPIVYRGIVFKTINEYLIEEGFTEEQIPLIIQEITEEEFYKID